MLNEGFALRDTGCSNGDQGASLPRHRWYRVKESFSPALVESAVAELDTPGASVVIDPFCGSGTTVVTCALRGQASQGIELNPFLAFIARTKLARTTRKTLTGALRDIRPTVRQGRKSPLEGLSTFTERPGVEKWLFNTPICRAFEGGWRASGNQAAQVRDLLRLALLGAAMDTCNAVRDGKCLRYRSDWEKSDFGTKDFLGALETRVAEISDDLSHTPKSGVDARIRSGDSRKVVRALEPGTFDLCVTSPPYLNSFDYSDVYRPELFLGGFVRSNDQLMSLRLRTVRSHVQASWKAPRQSDFGELYRSCTDKVREREDRLWDKRIPMMIRAYFEDLDGLLRGLYAAAAERASVWLVVSTSAYAGVEIPVDLILAEIGTRTGWALREVGVLRYLRTSGQHWARWSATGERGKPRLRESVVILDKRPAKSRSRRAPAS